MKTTSNTLQQSLNFIANNHLHKRQICLNFDLIYIGSWKVLHVTRVKRWQKFLWIEWLKGRLELRSVLVLKYKTNIQKMTKQAPYSSTLRFIQLLLWLQTAPSNTPCSSYSYNMIWYIPLFSFWLRVLWYVASFFWIHWVQYQFSAQFL